MDGASLSVNAHTCREGGLRFATLQRYLIRDRGKEEILAKAQRAQRKRDELPSLSFALFAPWRDTLLLFIAGCSAGVLVRATSGQFELNTPEQLRVKIADALKGVSRLFLDTAPSSTTWSGTRLT